jgi:DNA-binding NarL/FixJ family response regulator
MRILLADDHPIFRKGLKALIQDHYNHCTIDEVDNGQEAIDQLNYNKYSITVLDIDMPHKSGIEVLKHIRENKIHTKPIILTMHNDELFFNAAFNQGAIGFLLKEDSTLEIVECIENILADVPFVSKKLTPYLKNRKNFNSQLAEIKSKVNSLSKSEFNTLKLVSENKTSREIAELLFVTEKSVENYRSRICKKLNISGGSNTLYKWCIEHKDLIIQDI